MIQESLWFDKFHSIAFLIHYYFLSVCQDLFSTYYHFTKTAFLATQLSMQEPFFHYYDDKMFPLISEFLFIFIITF